jgi:NAD(P)-dependent dehydrogenase (short-subunit alcohol dehydrogenase family)
MFNFDGRLALVTGGTSGLGRAICLEFARYGAKIAIVGRREKEGEETLSLVKDLGSSGIFIPCDVVRSEDVQKMVNKCMSEFGHIDFAVNNAGYYGKASFLTKFDEDEFDKVISINLKGVFLCLKYELGVMLKQGHGSIVNVSSVNGLISMPFGVSAYSASKHGIIGLTKSSALEFAKKNIRINAVCPGGIQTEMLSDVFTSSPNPGEAEKAFLGIHPMGRFAKSEEVAKTIVWMCSDEASYINGVALPIDGGLTAH